MEHFLVRTPLRLALLLGIATLHFAAAAVQTGAQSPVAEPTVVALGLGQVELTPDVAEVVLGVEVQASTAEVAALDMSGRLDAVGDTLASLGFPPDSFPRTAFAVRPRYDPALGRQLVGFDAAVSLTLRTTDLESLAQLIGAALGAGATTVSSVSFMSTQQESAEFEALRQPFEHSRRQAETLAQSSGFRLGAPQSITTPSQSTLVNIRGMGGGAPLQQLTSISTYAVQPQRVQVRATVTVQWQLLGS